MNRNLIIGGIAAIAIVVVAFILNQPEPTPEERLSDAVEQATEAVGDSVAAVSEAASEAGAAVQEGLRHEAEGLEQRLTEAATQIATEVATASEQAQQSLQTMIDDWQANGIVTENGVDYDRALAAVGESTMSDDAKQQLTQFLSMLRDAPEMAAQKLAELETALSQ